MSEVVSNEVYAFLDTNFLMHFPTIDSVDWCNHLQAESVTLVIDQQVLRELDELKDGARGQGRRDKARSVVPKLYKLLASDEPITIRENVYIIGNTNAVNIDFVSERMNPAVQDDLIVAGMMTFREDHPDARIVLIANDGGIRLRAHTKKFESWDPGEVLQRSDIATDEEKEVLSLRRQVIELQNKKPKFEFGFKVEDKVESYTRFAFSSLPKDQASEELIQAHLQNERTACLSGVVVAKPFITQDMVDEYVRKVSTHLKRFEESLRFRSLIQSCYQLRFSFALHNTGATTRHVEVVVKVPHTAVLARMEDRGEVLSPLNPPHRPRRPSAEDMFGSSSYLSPGLIESLRPNIPVIPLQSYADVEDTEVSEDIVTWSLPIVRSGEWKFSDELVAFVPKTVGQGIGLEYSILSADGDPIKGALNFRFEVDEGVGESEEGRGETVSDDGET